MGVILGFIGMICLGLFIRLLSVEIGIWHKPLCRWLVKIAAARLPEGERAAAESEWLAIIEDLRSPTTQLLHSLSYVFSAFQIRQAIDPEEARAIAFAKGVISGSTLTIASLAGVVTGFVSKGDDPLHRLQVLITKPTTRALILGALLLMNYLNYRYLMWRLKRQERQRAGDAARRTET